MAITKSAKKAVKRSEKMRARNLVFKLEMKSSIKKLKKAVSESSWEFDLLLKKAYSSIDRAARRNIIHKNNASRKKSNLSKLVNKSI